MISVFTGWHRFREIDTVVYDPERITPAMMVEALKKAGTYIGTAE